MRFTFPPFCLGVAHLSNSKRGNKGTTEKLRQPGYPAIYLCPSTDHHAIKFEDDVHRTIGHIVLDTQTRRIEFTTHFVPQLDVFPWAIDLTGENVQDEGLLKRKRKRKGKLKTTPEAQKIHPGKVSAQEAPCDTSGVDHAHDEEKEGLEDDVIEPTQIPFNAPEPPETSKEVYSLESGDLIHTKQVWSSHLRMWQSIPIDELGTLASTSTEPIYCHQSK